MNYFIKKNRGWMLLLFLAIIPIIRWFWINDFDYKFGNLGNMATSFGQIAGLLGMILFSLNLIIGSKFKFVDKIFFGLPDALNIHAVVGGISFCLILFHPLLLVVEYWQFSINSAVMFFVPYGTNAVSFGIYALAFMILLIIATYYIKLKYQIWLFSHRFLILAFVLAFIHTFLISSDVSRDLFLRYYMMFFGSLGLILSLYNLLSDKIFSRNLEYYVRKVDKLAENITQIILEPRKNTIKFFPGQFVFVKFKSKNKLISQEIHPFTISSKPNGNLEFNIKSLGDFTNNVSNLQVGDLALINGPFGKFSYKEFDDKDQIWIAGGIGITPFLSMARAINSEKVKKRIDLYYCTNNESEAVLLDELLEIKAINKYFNIIPWYSDSNKFITANDIVKLSHGLGNKEIFLCGPIKFIENLKLQFFKLGVKNKNIHWEKFSF